MLLASDEDEDVEMAVLITMVLVAIGVYNILGGLVPAVSLSGDGRRFMMDVLCGCVRDGCVVGERMIKIIVSEAKM